jgi:RecJ-like exonuclease
MIKNEEYDNKIIETIATLVKKQKFMAIEKYGHFHNIHEFFAVLKEEIEEAENDFSKINTQSKIMWLEIKKDESINNYVNEIHKLTFNCIKELIQVMAVCDKYYMMEDEK